MSITLTNNQIQIIHQAAARLDVHYRQRFFISVIDQLGTVNDAVDDDAVARAVASVGEAFFIKGDPIGEQTNGDVT